MNAESSRARDLYNRVCTQGAAAVDEFILTRQAEELFLDFKRSSDNGAGARLSQDDRDNLAKAISGFGNSAGGVIVWGVDCSRSRGGADVADAKIPIEDPHRFASWLNAAVSGCTLPPHGGVLNTPIPDETGRRGFVVTLIPQSNHAPHQVVRRVQYYYIRAGSDFVPAPHQVLAGLFGKRPQPYVYVMFNVGAVEVRAPSLCCQVGILLRNDGPGVADDLYLTAMVHSTPSDNCTCAFQPPDLQRWDVITSWGRHITIMSKREIRLPPDAQVQPLSIAATFAPPFNDPFEIHGTVGAGSAAPFSFDLVTSSGAMKDAYAECHEKARCGFPDADQHAFVSRLMGLKNPGNE